MLNRDRIAQEFKAPGETLDFGWDWTRWLAARGGVTVSSALAAITSGTATLEAATSHDTTGSWFRISGGTAGTTVEVTTTIVTSDGQSPQGLHRIFIG